MANYRALPNGVEKARKNVAAGDGRASYRVKTDISA